MHFSLSLSNKFCVDESGMTPRWYLLIWAMKLLQLPLPGKICLDLENFHDLRLVHVIRDFHPGDVMTKVCYFLIVQIYNLMSLEVEHDLETCQRP